MKSSLRIFVSVTCILFMAGTSNAVAQERMVEDKLHRVTKHLKTGALLRLKTTFDRLEGRLLTKIADTIWLSTNSGQRRVHLASIETLFVRGNASGTGLLVGATVGLGAGLSLRSMGAELCGFGNSEKSGLCSHVIVLAAVGGLVVGSALGALIGSTIPQWHRRYHNRFSLSVLPNKEGGVQTLVSISF